MAEDNKTLSNNSKIKSIVIGGAAALVLAGGVYAVSQNSKQPEPVVETTVVETTEAPILSNDYSKLVNRWFSNEMTYKADIKYTNTNKGTVVESDAFGGLHKYVADSMDIDLELSRDGHEMDSKVKYKVKGKSVSLDLRSRDHQLYVGTDGLIDSIRPTTSKEHAKTMDEMISDQWLNIGGFRKQLEVTKIKEQTNTPSIAVDFESDDYAKRVEDWLMSLPEEAVVRKNNGGYEVAFNTEQARDLLLILGAKDLNAFITKADGVLTLTDDELLIDADLDLIVYGLSLKGRIDTTITSGEFKELEDDVIKDIDIKQFIAYYFGLLTTEVKKFTDEEFKTIEDVIREERESMTPDERKDLFRDLNRAFFTDEQWKTLALLLTEKLEGDSKALTAEERAARQKRFEELQKMIAEKEAEQSKLISVTPITQITSRPPAPTPSTVIDPDKVETTTKMEEVTLLPDITSEESSGEESTVVQPEQPITTLQPEEPTPTTPIEPEVTEAPVVPVVPEGEVVEEFVGGE